MNNLEYDNNEISRIQFHTNLSQKDKNHLISIIEKRMAKMEALELDGKNTGGYYK